MFLTVAARRVVATSTVNEIVQYIKGCSDFFKSQDGLLSDDLRRDSITSMAATIVRNTMGVKELDAAGASSLNGSIAGSSFPATEKSAFAVAVVERLTAPAAAGGGDALAAMTDALKNATGTYLPD